MSQLTPETLEDLRVKLEGLQQTLRERLHQTLQGSKPVDLGEPIGRLSRVDALASQQMTQAQRLRDEGQLRAVGGALARLRAGSYGECIQCGEEIPLERLRIAPESTQCIPCRRSTEDL